MTSTSKRTERVKIVKRECLECSKWEELVLVVTQGNSRTLTLRKE